MPTLGEMFAVGTTLKGPGGKEYKLRPLKQFEQAEFSAWLEQRAHDAVDRSKAPDEAKVRRHAVIDKDAAVGMYEWEGPYAFEAATLLPGLAKALELCCRDQGVTGEQAAEVVMHNALDVARGILAQKGRDPKALRPVLEALGLPTDWLGCDESDSSSSSCSTRHSTDPSTNCGTAPTTSCSPSTTSSEAPTG
jgi:hypothetical protein